MKIHLINFRCYEDETFDFGDDGLILISATSGAGKSTILMAIHFALFGIGSKVTSAGKTSCKVEFEYKDLKVVRTKRPNRLLVNDIYEDDEGQKIINEKFGDVFDVTGYISQNALNSFILKSPSDKLEFLEQFAFKDIDLMKIKDRAKTVISQKNDQLKKTITQIETTSEIFNNMNKPELAHCPFKSKKYDYETLVKNEHLKLKKCNNNLVCLPNEIEKLQAQLNSLKLLENSVNNKEENINILNEKLKTIINERESIAYEGDDILHKYKKILDIILSQKELIHLEDKLQEDTQKLEKMKQIEVENFNKELEHITKSLWIEYNVTELKSMINDTKICIDDAKKITFLKKEFMQCDVNIETFESNKTSLETNRSLLKDNYELLEKLNKQKTMYLCPSCNNKLHFKDNKLYVIEIDIDNTECDINTIKKEISRLEIDIKKLANTISSDDHKLGRKTKIENDILDISSNYDEELNEDSLKEDLEYLEQYYKAERAKEKSKILIENKLINNEFSSSCIMFEKDLLKLKNKVEILKKNNEDCSNYTEEETRQIISNETNNRDTINRLQKNIESIEHDINRNTKEIIDMRKNYVDKYGEIKSISYIESIIDDNKKLLLENETKRTSALSTIENIKKYDEYIENNKKYELWANKLDELQEKEKEDRMKYSASLMFKENILVAESIAVSIVVESINTHAQIYLDCFFPENPMIVRLLSFKETKKNTKPQINIEIDYKGMECDLNSLSGGELSRVVLAFTLALAEMFNTPLLLLDESTASLDQDSTTIVFDAIKENFKDKMVVIIAHQVVEGVFDKIIKL